MVGIFENTLRDDDAVGAMEEEGVRSYPSQSSFVAPTLEKISS